MERNGCRRAKERGNERTKERRNEGTKERWNEGTIVLRLSGISNYY